VLHPWSPALGVPGFDEDLLDFLKDASPLDIKDYPVFMALRFDRAQRGKKY
jgi:hypothetical protein